jgi:hypothetical protein
MSWDVVCFLSSLIARKFRCNIVHCSTRKQDRTCSHALIVLVVIRWQIIHTFIEYGRSTIASNIDCLSRNWSRISCSSVPFDGKANRARWLAIDQVNWIACVVVYRRHRLHENKCCSSWQSIVQRTSERTSRMWRAHVSNTCHITCETMKKKKARERRRKSTE